MKEFDVVVLGAGLSGGLPAAAYLQKAGARVALVEQGVDAGRFYLSYDLLPGARFDHSPVNFSGLSPAVGDLDLMAHGYALRIPEVTLAALDPGGASAVFYRDPARTHAQFARHSQADADQLAALFGRLGPRASRLLQCAIYTPHPNQAAYDEAVDLSAEILEMPRAALLRMTGVELLEGLFESDEVRRFFIDRFWH